MVDKKGQSEDVSMIDVRQVFSDRDFVHLACSKMCQFVSVLQVPHAFLILCELSANVSVYGKERLRIRYFPFRVSKSIILYC